MPTVATNWVVVKKHEVKAVLDQLVTDAADVKLDPSDPASPTRLDYAIWNNIAIVRGAIRAGGKIPLSLTDGTVPLEAKQFVSVMAAMACTAAKPNLSQVIVGPTGMYAPLNDMLKKAYEFVKACREGYNVEEPVDPQPLGWSTANPAGLLDSNGDAVPFTFNWGDNYATAARYAVGENPDGSNLIPLDMNVTG